MPSKILSVSELNGYMQQAVRKAAFLQSLQIRGEISNFKSYASGHWYFTLKDENAQVSCVMFRGANAKLSFKPRDGMAVEIDAAADFYSKSGQFQLVLRHMRQAGLGELYLAYEALKGKLQKEGLFDPAHKKGIPFLPRRIGVITSPTGAVIRDIIHVLSRRFPNFDLLLAPCQVQGATAAPSMIEALKRLQKVPDIELIIIGRGGGSLEDLWAFNDERLARALYACPIPLISAVGHETDFSICDFVCDLRAPTPSAAAELAVPVYSEMAALIMGYEERAQLALQQTLERRWQQLRDMERRIRLRHPMLRLREEEQRLDRLQEGLATALSRQAMQCREQLNRLWTTLERAAADHCTREQRRLSAAAARLDAMSPLKVLARGYGMALAPDDEKPISSIIELRRHEKFRLRLSDGEAMCRAEAFREISAGAPADVIK